MLEITRELVEHYLRATGWTFDPSDGWWFGTDASGNQERAFPASWILASGLDADVAARMAGHRVNAVTLAFRLGLCAAAEELLQTAVALTDDIANPKYYDKPLDEWRAVERNIREEAADIIRLTGIDPAAWESARKR